MSESNEKKSGWKQKIGHELVEYWIYVAFCQRFIATLNLKPDPI
jgi:hypothetical protein